MSEQGRCALITGGAQGIGLGIGQCFGRKGATIAVARKLIAQRRLPRDEEIVLCITGNGLKTQEAVVNELEEAPTIKPSLAEFEPLLEQPVLV